MSEKITFETICGTSINYARFPVAPYGTRGKPKAQCGPVEPSFLAALEAWMTTLSELCPWGKPELLVTAGIIGDGHGMHGLGRAIDIDSLFWTNGHLITKEGRKHLAWYYSIESTLRMHFGVVLNMEYNGAHEDHWHVDDGQSVGWIPKTSRVLFLQAVLKNIWKLDVSIDGEFGPATHAATAEITKRFNCNLRNDWIDFLRYTAKKGFAQAL